MSLSPNDTQPIDQAALRRKWAQQAPPLSCSCCGAPGYDCNCELHPLNGNGSDGPWSAIYCRTHQVRV